MQDPVVRLNAALAVRYRVERRLGEGGMATVYLADDLRHARKVALKVLKPELAAVLGSDRFLAEIRTTANLQHPLPESAVARAAQLAPRRSLRTPVHAAHSITVRCPILRSGSPCVVRALYRSARASCKPPGGTRWDIVAKFS
jgi:serine/threonine protein kinase